MKLRMKIDAPEEEDLSSPSQNPILLESVFEEELPLLCRQIENLTKNGEAEFSVTFLDQAEMRELNKKHRGLDEPTDVLAFPLWEEGEDFAPPPFGLLPLGDIVICPEEAEREHFPRPRREVLCLVLAHGFLHLLGWDHDTPEKEEIMWERQELLKSELLNVIEPKEAS